MLFTSYGFIAFVAVLLVLYYVVPKKTQWMLLLAASYFFYAFSGLWNFAFIISVTVSAYVIARIIARMKDKEDIAVEQHRDVWSKDERKQYRASKKKSRLWVLILGVVLNLGILAVIKYTEFAVSNVSSIITLFGGKPLGEVNFPMILGISYFVFQSVGYMIDVYRGKTFAEKNIARFALFVSFFPQLVQGPISRHSDLATQLYEPHKLDGVKLKFGLQRILWGLFKKLVIADRILVAVSKLTTSDSSYDGAYVFLLIIFYSIQIYADFTGGIDIAIGIAEALGMRLAENFNRPFSSRSTKEYWNRWHMTMGSWFNDYIFLPLSVTKPLLKLSKAVRSKDSRFMKGLGKRIPVYIATTVTWLATGIWHGAAWNFVVWGLLNCLVILISQELEPLYRRFRNKFPKLVSSYPYHCFEATRTFLLMGLIRTLDCYRNVGVTFAKWWSMLTTFNWGELFVAREAFLGLKAADYIIVAVGVLIIFLVSKLGAKRDLRQALIGKTFLSWGLAFALLMVILLFGAYGINFGAIPSIYGQF